MFSQHGCMSVPFSKPLYVECLILLEQKGFTVPPPGVTFTIAYFVLRLVSTATARKIIIKQDLAAN